MINCVSSIYLFITFFAVIASSTCTNLSNYHQLPDGVLGNIIKHAPPKSMANVRLISRRHHQFTETHYFQTFLYLSETILKHAISYPNNTKPNSTMHKHQNDNRFNQLLRANFPYLLQDLKELKHYS